MKQPALCYICGEQLLRIPSGHDGCRSPRHVTKDHIPPLGLFNDPKPTNLITVCCCNECNGKHSDFDEQIRVLCALEFASNAGGKHIVETKVFGSTMKKLRQRDFMMGLHQTMRPESIQTSNGPETVVKFTTSAEPVHTGVINITKGLLAHHFPKFDYHHLKFMVIDIHTATLAKGQAKEQLDFIHQIESRIKGESRGQFNEFRFWRQVELETGRGVWLLKFYEAISFIILHHPTSDYYE